MAESHDLLGVGLYTLNEVVALLGAERRFVRNTLFGYHYKDTRSGERRYVDPIITRGLSESDSRTVTFLDLMELRFVQVFREHISLRTIRSCAKKARTIFGSSHPFALNSTRFLTNGKTIYAKDERKFLDLLKSQYAMEEVVQVFLRDVEFEMDTLARWFPRGFDGPIVLDPKRSFGAPIHPQTGIQAVTLYHAYRAEGRNADEVSRWYGVSPADVEATVEFVEQTGLAAA